MRGGIRTILLVLTSAVFAVSCNRTVSEVTSGSGPRDELRAAINRTLAIDRLKWTVEESTSAREDPTEPDEYDPDSRSVSHCDGPRRMYTKQTTYDTVPPVEETIEFDGHEYTSNLRREGYYEDLYIERERPTEAGVRCAMGELMSVRRFVGDVTRTPNGFRFTMAFPEDYGSGFGSVIVDNGYVVKMRLTLDGDRFEYVFDVSGNAPAVTPPPQDRVTEMEPSPTCDPEGNPPSAAPGEEVSACTAPATPRASGR
jgi:hypothetical protein